MERCNLSSNNQLPKETSTSSHLAGQVLISWCLSFHCCSSKLIKETIFERKLMLILFRGPLGDFLSGDNSQFFENFALWRWMGGVCLSVLYESWDFEILGSVFRFSNKFLLILILAWDIDPKCLILEMDWNHPPVSLACWLLRTYPCSLLAECLRQTVDALDARNEKVVVNSAFSKPMSFQRFNLW